MGTYKWFPPTTPGILGDRFCCTMLWWGSRIDELMGLPPGLYLQDCLSRRVWFHHGLKSSFLTR